MHVPDGWRLVPVEPTDDMVIAGDEKALQILKDHTFSLKSDTLATQVYRAMLAASPSNRRKGERDE